jgi:hypothetical protein
MDDTIKFLRDNGYAEAADRLTRLEAERDNARAIAYLLSHAWEHDAAPLQRWVDAAQKWELCTRRARGVDHA